MLTTIIRSLKGLWALPGPFYFSTEDIDRRLRTRPNRIEIITLGVAVAVLILSLTAHILRDHIPYDFYNYVKTSQGDFSNYYYAHWLLPIFYLFGQFDIYTGYFIWGILNIAGAYYAMRVFGGRPLVVMLSFQLFYVLYFGQITGVIAGALALQAWALAHDRWDFAGIGMALAISKYQMGIPLSLAIWLLADINWRERLRVLFVPSLVIVLSLLIYPGWPIRSLNTILQNPPNDYGSISLWRWIGYSALVLWLPTLILKMDSARRMVLIAATIALTIPYFQQTDLLFLLSMPINGIGLLGILGYSFFIFGWDAMKWLFILPLGIYLILVYTPLKRGISKMCAAEPNIAP